jgi:hydroxymethylpyrimidine/phosphomethylpyrimidine kinase
MTGAARGRVLIVAGSDSGGGAGIQADIKSVTMLGGYAATAVTALTAQTTEGVFGVLPVPVAFIAQQMRLVLDDIGADAIKTGMLHDAEVIGVVVEVLAEAAPGIPLVVDPVMIAKGGASLLAESALEALRRRLLPRATVLTPNLPEAEALLGHKIGSVEAMEEAAKDLRAMGPRFVLLKGGHLEGSVVTDVLAGADGVERFQALRIETRHTHGTGCTLASAIAAGLAQGLAVRDAVSRARDYVLGAIRAAPGFGRGHGPLGHGWMLQETSSRD